MITFPWPRRTWREKRAEASYHSRLLALFKSAISMARISALFDASTTFAVTIGQLIVARIFQVEPEEAARLQMAGDLSRSRRPLAPGGVHQPGERRRGRIGR